MTIMPAIVLNLNSVIKLDAEQFLQLSLSNKDIRMEINAQGKLILMPPTGGETGEFNSEINYQLTHWNKQASSGKTFDSSIGFSLPNGGDRSPDAAWIKLERWEALNEKGKESFPPICPDFVIELSSKIDNFKQLQAKMPEYLDSGLRLGWLIERYTKIVEIYRQGKEVEVLESPAMVSGEDVLPGFVLDIKGIF